MKTKKERRQQQRSQKSSSYSSTSSKAAAAAAANSAEIIVLSDSDEAIAATVSESPSDIDTKKEQNNDDDNDDVSPSGARRSKRKKVSTCINIGGHMVKRENNYVVKGMTYHFNEVPAEDATSANAAKKKKQNKKKKGGETNSDGQQVPSPSKKPRKLAPAEEERMRLKECIAKNIRDKAPARQAFFASNVHTLEPFCDAAVVSKLKQRRASPSKGGSAPLDSIKSVYIQPDSINGELRDYQMEGLNFMSQKYQQNVGMILGDEMGLGKTLQTIALICHIKETFGASGPNLVICPLSVLYSWCSEIERWGPSLKYRRFHSSNPESLTPEELETLGSCDVVVTTYEMAKNPALKNMWRRQHFNLLVLDEGHKIKNRDSQISEAVRKLHSEQRIILTGTPLANNLVELWSLLNFLSPDVFTTSEPFAEAFDLAANVVDPVKLEQAHDVLKLFMIRRLKTEVEKLLPKKIETKVICPLSTMQIWWYKAVLLKDLRFIAGEKVGNAGQLANLIMQLRKVCLHPFLFDGAEDDPEETTLEDLVGASGKLAVLDMLLRSLYEKKHRVTLFSQFTSVLDILEDYCKLRGWNFCRFDGNTSRARRNHVVNSFNAPNSDKFIFLMSTKSGGMGLNLQTADTCILFDSDWNPQPDIQAMARVHRIGQKKTVHVYRLVTHGTVEQRMLERADKKLYLDKMCLQDGAGESNDNKAKDKQDASSLLKTLRFGCNAVFGEASTNQNLPTNEDIETITDRSRTEDFSDGKLKGAAESNINDFDAKKEFIKTTDFGGVDFVKIREEYAKKKKPKDLSEITDLWKRKRKQRIMLVDGMGSGYGNKLVPILASNDYDLQTGEKSVFDRELQGRKPIVKAKKAAATFESMDICQICGDGGKLICCGHCPVSLHLNCLRAGFGVTNVKEFQRCTHHSCTVCFKSASAAGGLLFPCAACPNSYCEDHLPASATIMEDCEYMEARNGFKLKNGFYCHCSANCVRVAKREFAWKPAAEKPRDLCPPPLDLSAAFNGEIDDSLETPDELIVPGKRRRKSVNYAVDTKVSPSETFKVPPSEEAKVPPSSSSVSSSEESSYCTSSNSSSTGPIVIHPSISVPAASSKTCTVHPSKVETSRSVDALHSPRSLAARLKELAERNNHGGNKSSDSCTVS